MWNQHRSANTQKLDPGNQESHSHHRGGVWGKRGIMVASSILRWYIFIQWYWWELYLYQSMHVHFPVNQNYVDRCPQIYIFMHVASQQIFERICVGWSGVEFAEMMSIPHTLFLYIVMRLSVPIWATVPVWVLGCSHVVCSATLKHCWKSPMAAMPSFSQLRVCLMVCRCLPLCYNRSIP